MSRPANVAANAAPGAGASPTPCAPASAPVDTAWRILLVDDCVDDADLVAIELQAAGIAAQFRRVDDEAGLLAALAGFRPQLVLSDLNMPGFSGHMAHALVREHAPEARFAFLSGSQVEFGAGPPASPPTSLPNPCAPRELPAPLLLKDELHRLPALVRELLGG